MNLFLALCRLLTLLLFPALLLMPLEAQADLYLYVDPTTGHLALRTAPGGGDPGYLGTAWGGFGVDMSAATGIVVWTDGVPQPRSLVDADIPDDHTINTSKDATVGNLTATSVTTTRTSGQTTTYNLYEDPDNGDNKVGLTVPAALGADYVATLFAATDTVVGKATTDTLTNKTLDANGTGNTVKGYKYLTFTHPHMRGAGATGPDTTATNEYYGQFTFADDADEATNYVEYRCEVPRDIDTSVDLVAWFKFRLAGADTADHDYVISMVSVADSGDYTGTVGNAINLSYTADASGADGDVETAGGDTLTDWKSNVTAGQLWVIRVARDGDDGTNDASTTDSYSGPLTIRYGFTN